MLSRLLPGPNIVLWMCSAVYVQHDADEVFLFILNFLQEQMDDDTLVCLYHVTENLP